MKISHIAIAALAGLSLAGCATSARTGPVEVTRFVEPGAPLGQGTIFVETAPGLDADSLALAPYKAAIARELAALGYVETSRAQASQIAQVRIEKYRTDGPERQRSPVNVGVGGSTGSYGSGVGVGVGINLGGGGGSGETLDTQLGVMIRDGASGQTFWEGRAQLSVGPGSPYAATEANASAIADALFREFPGNNGETVQVRVTK